jgi:hypothetical protein
MSSSLLSNRLLWLSLTFAAGSIATYQLYTHFFLIARQAKKCRSKSAVFPMKLDGSQVPLAISSKHPLAYHKMLQNTEIHLFSSAEVLEAELNYIFKQYNYDFRANKASNSNCSALLFLGLDCEWVSFRKNSALSLLQITLNHHTLLIRLQQLAYFPRNLADLLSDSNVLKCGVAIIEDKKKLCRDYGVEVNGCIELAALLSRTQFTILNENSGNHTLKSESTLISQQLSYSLATLCQKVLNSELPKDNKIVRSDWEKELTIGQILYAAADAYYGYKIFEQLLKSKFNENSISYEKLKNWTVGLSDKSSNSSNKPKKDKSKGKQGNSDSNKLELKEDLNGILKPEKPSRGSDRQSSLYENCRMLSPEGVLMAYINKKKVNWYVERGLAVIVQESPAENNGSSAAHNKVSDSGTNSNSLGSNYDISNNDNENKPITIKLKFQPGGLGNAAIDYDREMSNFYLEESCNMCVRCGSTASYRKHYIIPTAYRRNFPTQFKSHSSHDIVLLCPFCHRLAEDFTQKLTRIIAKETNYPLHNQAMDNSAENQALKLRKAVINAGYTLKQHGNELPQARKAELERVLMNYYTAESFNEELVNKALFLKEHSKNLEESKEESVEKVVNLQNSHYELVVRKLIELAENNESHDGVYSYFENDAKVVSLHPIHQFCVRWRKWFISNLQPKYLSQNWSVYFTKITQSKRNKQQQQQQQQQ